MNGAVHIVRNLYNIYNQHPLAHVLWFLDPLVLSEKSPSRSPLAAWIRMVMGRS